jgi:MSHA pilin protein MshD
MSIPSGMVGRHRDRQAGVSLIELIMFMVIVSVGLAGILSVMNLTVRNSADPMVRKQAIAIAEALLEEIELQPFTYCDPDDLQAATATSAAVGVPGVGCTTANDVEGFGASALQGESRGSTTAPFDNVYDYAGALNGAAGFSMAGIKSIENPAIIIPALAGYTATVSITQNAVGTVPAAASLQIDVRVTFGNAVDVTLTGYRMRYAPNATP